MKILFAALVCALPLASNAQVFLRASAGASYTALRNKSDREGVYGIDNRFTVRPAAGLELGVRLREGSDLQAVSVGAQYVNVAQNYGVALHLVRGPGEADGVRSVQYLRVPLMFTFALSHHGRLKPLLMMGAYYARQIGHRDALSQMQNGTTLFEYEAANGEYLNSYGSRVYRGEYEGSYYKPFDAGALAGFSLEYDLGDGLFIDMGLRASYGLTRIENRTYLAHTLTVDNFTMSPPINPYRRDDWLATMYGIPVLPPHGIRYSDEERPQSYTLAAGIEIGVKYIFRRRGERGGTE